MIVEWKEDRCNNVLDGYIRDRLLYVIDMNDDSDKFKLYQFKIDFDGSMEFDTIEQAKEYCEKIESK